MLCYWQFLLTPVKTFVSDLNSPQIHAVTRENERLINARVSFVFFLCGHLYFFLSWLFPHLPLLLSLSATMATAKDFPEPTAGNYLSRQLSQATITLCEAGSGSWSRLAHDILTAWVTAQPCMDANTSCSFRPVLGCLSSCINSVWIPLCSKTDKSSLSGARLKWSCGRTMFKIIFLGGVRLSPEFAFYLCGF